MKRVFPFLIILLILTGLTASLSASAAKQQVDLDFFWSLTCPHCQEARPFVEDLAKEFDWLHVHSYEVTQHPDNAKRYVETAKALGANADSVPAFVLCDHLYIGFDRPDGVGKLLHQAIQTCRDGGEMPESLAESTILPAGIDPDQMSLPLFTLAIAALDAFNPCAFFVLLFLLSLLVNARSRARMLFIGGVFVFCSGLVYFLFMAAWLALFLRIGALGWVTLSAGLLAVVIGVINIKDFFFFRQGPSLSLTDGAKSSLFARMRHLLTQDHLGMLLIGTIALALAANSYELLCTAGFPMVYTRVLTLQTNSDTAYYLYLLLYNLVYITPLLVILLVFTFTLGRRKLSEGEGRLLKLLSGYMMFGLGILLLVAPDWLNQLWTGIGLLALAVCLSWLTYRLKPV